MNLRSNGFRICRSAFTTEILEREYRGKHILFARGKPARYRLIKLILVHIPAGTDGVFDQGAGSREHASALFEQFQPLPGLPFFIGKLAFCGVKEMVIVHSGLLVLAERVICQCP